MSLLSGVSISYVGEQHKILHKTDSLFQYFTIAINALSLSFAVAAILIRLRDPQQRFMLKKTERAEGVYLVVRSL